ncbi:TVP38/TMEM64 family protein [Synechocystis sp. PCC 7339]|uniref:TVP38/TMEM64 family protein n=1 Tax=unclassified Synechocystis TaxID=2640012 RepID=UPI001BAFD273|nr:MULTISPECIES: TVP38/TMEM64 family protein [unclassified Synechocystis]QUS60161.1 TVP38/TMEM64 family protein [Synechocystis sp. PCC 7338]UAJ72393.1 TVP38/TMEM64 family protein [Synechocystis sp. PCC 7339]
MALNILLAKVKNLGWWAPSIYIAAYNLATILLLPGSLLTMKGGCLFGWWWGTIYTTIAAMIGATIAFLIGRHFSRNWVQKKMTKYPKFKLLNAAVKKDGWKIVILTRLSPIFPFNLLNYGFGVTDVSLKDYILGSLAMIPATIAYTYIGSLATGLTTIGDNLNNQTQIIQWSMRLCGLGATVFLIIYLKQWSDKVFQQSLSNLESKK